jgi:hypothetical protein
VDVVEAAVLEVERPAADPGALADQNAFGAGGRDVGVGCDGVGADDLALAALAPLEQGQNQHDEDHQCA